MMLGAVLNEMGIAVSGGTAPGGKEFRSVEWSILTELQKIRGKVEVGAQQGVFFYREELP